MYSTSKKTKLDWAFNIATSFMVITFLVLIGMLVFMVNDSGFAEKTGNSKPGSHNDRPVSFAN